MNPFHCFGLSIWGLARRCLLGRGLLSVLILGFSQVPAFRTPLLNHARRTREKSETTRLLLALNTVMGDEHCCSIACKEHCFPSLSFLFNSCYDYRKLAGKHARIMLASSMETQPACCKNGTEAGGFAPFHATVVEIRSRKEEKWINMGSCGA